MKTAVFWVGLTLLSPQIIAMADNSYEIIETTDLKKIFNTNDPKELSLAQTSLMTSDTVIDDRANYYDVASYAGVLLCVRKIIEKGHGGLEGTAVAADLLVELTDTIYLQQRGSALRLKCENYLNSATSVRVDRDEQAKFVAHLDGYDSEVKTMLYRYIKPTTTCFVVGGQIDVGLLAVVGSDIGLEYCHANNGRHWIQMAVEGRAGYGGMGLAVFHLGNYRYRMNHLGGPFTYTKTRDSTWVVGFGMSSSEYGEHYAHSRKGVIFVIPSRQHRNLGIGLGYAKTWGRRGGLKFLPLGTRTNKLVAEYVSLSSNDLLIEQETLPKELRSSTGRALLRVDIDDSQQVKFIFCDADGNKCHDLAAGNRFSLSLLTENIQALQVAHQDAKDRAFEAKLRKIAGAGAALTVAAPLTIRSAIEKYSEEKSIPLTKLIARRRAEGVSDRALPYRGERGIFSIGNKSLDNLWEPARSRLQKLANSKFSKFLHTKSDGFIHSYSKIFAHSGARYIVPVIALVGGGIVALVSWLDESNNSRTATKLEEMDKQRQELSRLLADPDSQLVIYDQQLMIETLKYLLN